MGRGRPHLDHFSFIEGRVNADKFIEYLHDLSTTPRQDHPHRRRRPRTPPRKSHRIRKIHRRAAHTLLPPPVLAGTQSGRMGMEEREKRQRRTHDRPHHRGTERRNQQSNRPAPSPTGTHLRLLQGADLAYFKRPASKSADQISRSSVGRQDGCGHTPTNAASWGWVVTRVFGAFLLISYGLLV